MRIAAYQPRFMPWLVDLHKMKQVDLVILMDDVQLDDREYINRCKVMSYDKPVYMTVPLSNRSNHRGVLLRDVEVGTPPFDWKARHLEQISQYRLAAGYNAVIERLEEFYRMNSMYWYGPKELLVDLVKADRLLTWNYAALNFLAYWFKIETPYVISSQKYGECPHKGNDRILWLCQQAGATEYLLGTHSLAYMRPADFEAAGIKLVAHRFQHPAYRQYHVPDGFVDGLSSLDALLNLGTKAWEVLK